MCLFHFHMAIRPLWPQSWLLNLTWLDLIDGDWTLRYNGSRMQSLTVACWWPPISEEWRQGTGCTHGWWRWRRWWWWWWWWWWRSYGSCGQVTVQPLCIMHHIINRAVILWTADRWPVAVINLGVTDVHCKPTCLHTRRVAPDDQIDNWRRVDASLTWDCRSYAIFSQTRCYDDVGRRNVRSRAWDDVSNEISSWVDRRDYDNNITVTLGVNLMPVDAEFTVNTPQPISAWLSVPRSDVIQQQDDVSAGEELGRVRGYSRWPVNWARCKVDDLHCYGWESPSVCVAESERDGIVTHLTAGDRSNDVIGECTGSCCDWHSQSFHCGVNTPFIDQFTVLTCHLNTHVTP